MPDLNLAHIQNMRNGELIDANAFIAAVNISDMAYEVMQEVRSCCRKEGNETCMGDPEVCFESKVQNRVYDEIMWRFGREA